MQSGMSGEYDSLNSSVPNSPELLASNSQQDSSPAVLDRTPLQSRGKSRSVSGSHLLKRDLLSSFRTLDGSAGNYPMTVVMIWIWPTKYLNGRLNLEGMVVCLGMDNWEGGELLGCHCQALAFYAGNINNIVINHNCNLVLTPGLPLALDLADQLLLQIQIRQPLLQWEEPRPKKIQWPSLLPLLH